MLTYLEQLEARCSALKLNLDDVCEAAGVADTTLARWRKGESTCRQGTATALFAKIELMGQAEPEQAAMSVKSVSKTGPVRQSVSETEWQTRVELAACHRLMAHFGVHDLTHNHLTARVPDAPEHFLIKQADAMFDEVTASSLVKFDFDGNPQQDGFPKLRGGGLIIHAGLFAARADINVLFHTHTPANIAIASQKQGLLPMTQHGVRFHDAIAYHEFGGFEFNMEMRDPLIRDLGDKCIALLRNHGSLVCGDSIGGTYVDHHNLEIACQAQIGALAGGSEIILIDPKVREFAARQAEENAARRSGGGKDWVACMRLAERLDPGFME